MCAKHPPFRSAVRGERLNFPVEREVPEAAVGDSVLIILPTRAWPVAGLVPSMPAAQVRILRPEEYLGDVEGDRIEESGWYVVFGECGALGIEFDGELLVLPGRLL